MIKELIRLGKDLRSADARGEQLGLSDEELAFYDALETNDSAVKVLGDNTLKTIAQELGATVHRNAAIDWTIRDNVRAQLRVYVKGILRTYGSGQAGEGDADGEGPAAALSEMCAAT